MKMFDGFIRAWAIFMPTLTGVMLGLIVLVVYEDEAGIRGQAPEGAFGLLCALLAVLVLLLVLCQWWMRSRWLVVKTLLLGILGIGVAGLYVWLNEPAVGHELYFTMGVMALLHALFTFLVLYLPWTGRFRKRQK